MSQRLEAGGIDRVHLRRLIQKEEEVFAKKHPKSRELFEKARHHFLGGVREEAIYQDLIF